jgi:c-di-GMP-binding flagellar brake protein YcgR
MVKEGGFIQCVVVGRDERAVTAVPLRHDGDHLLSQLQAGPKIKVRFWRDGDTEYRFRTDILEFEQHTTSVRIRHAEELERVQQRYFYRIHVGLPIVLYALPLGVEESRRSGFLPWRPARWMPLSST